MFRYSCLAAVLFIQALVVLPAAAEKRVALVIGNAAVSYTHLTLPTILRV